MVVFLGFLSKLLGARDESRAPKGLLQKSKNTAVGQPQDSESPLSWFASIIVRELNTFEIAERHRLSILILSGFVKIDSPMDIVHKKVEMIILGVIAQSLEELSNYDSMRVESEKAKIEKDTERLRRNYTYFIELILPIVLQVDCIRGSLNFKTVMDKYFELGRELHKIEQLVVTAYNCELNIDSQVEWDDGLKRYVASFGSSGGKGSQ